MIVAEQIGVKKRETDFFYFADNSIVQNIEKLNDICAQTMP